jgi:hypothetical protein
MMTPGAKRKWKKKGKACSGERNEGVVPLQGEAPCSNGVDDMSPTSTTLWVSW